MAGTTIIHNDLVLNTTFNLKKSLSLKDRKCRINSESVKVEIKKNSHYTYPDVVVSCNDLENDPLSIKFPILIVEVLSDSTRKYDMNEKFAYYKQINSLKHYVLIEQDEYFVTVYTKYKDMWVHKSFSELTDTITLEHLEIEISVQEIYDNIDFNKK